MALSLTTKMIATAKWAASRGLQLKLVSSSSSCCLAKSPIHPSQQQQHLVVLLRQCYSSQKSISPLAMAAKPLVLCGPSGVGKSTLVARLTKEFPDAFGFSVSHTTRKPREGEKDGVNYHYVSREDMQKAIDNDEFIETAEFSGNMYGTSKAAVKTVMDQGRICILDIVS